MKKSLGSKRKEVSSDQTDEIVQTYHNFKENEFSKIFDNEFFGYTKVTIEQPTLKNGKVVKDKQGDPKPNTKLRDNERIPLSEDIEEYYNREVKPHLPNSWIDREKDKVGYEINFTKYFYEYKPLRSLEEIRLDILALEGETDGLIKAVIS